MLTSAMSAAGLLGQSLAPGARVLACAGPGVFEALADCRARRGRRRAGRRGRRRLPPRLRLRRARPGVAAVRQGARFVATNLDATYPTGDDLIPGAGSLVAAVAVAAGATPEVAGKPERADGRRSSAIASAHTGVMVGDRPSTDGALADDLGWPFALVLSGVTAAVAPPGGEAIPDPAPPFVAADLGELAPLLIAAFG